MITTIRKYGYGMGTAMALVFGLPGANAFAQTIIDQTPSNSGVVTVGGTNATITGVGDLSQSATASVGASGASASVAVAGINTQFINTAGGFGTVGQAATNSGAITTSNALISVTGPASAGDGASAGISAGGAAAGMSFTGNGAVNFSLSPPSVGAVTQSASNSGSVQNGGAADVSTITATSMVLSGDASSLSIGASGASASLSGAGIGAAGYGGQVFGAVSQSAVNEAADISNFGSVTAASSTGDGASISVSARGASSGVSETTIGTTAPKGNTYGAVLQYASNGVDGSASNIANSGSITLTGGLGGLGGSASLSASAATASFSVASLNNTASTTLVTLPSITQTASNAGTGAVTNTGILTLGGATGDLAVGASASISGMGAGTFASFTAIGPVLP